MREPRTIDERIEYAQTRANTFRRWAQEAADEAIGAAACGLSERAAQRAARGLAWREDADVWSATVGRLTTERRAVERAEVGPLVVEERDINTDCTVCDAPAGVPCEGYGAFNPSRMTDAQRKALAEALWHNDPIEPADFAPEHTGAEPEPVNVEIEIPSTPKLSAAHFDYGDGPYRF
jgi:hypothetical protein